MCVNMKDYKQSQTHNTTDSNGVTTQKQTILTTQKNHACTKSQILNTTRTTTKQIQHQTNTTQTNTINNKSN